ncbi:kinase-like domain-containing protein [Blastocladiella britannica]|nr:kinase-like domain-containing protein [Blastocladiella britannica]
MAPSTVTIEQLSGVSSSSSSRILLVNWHGKSLQNGKSRRLIVKVILAKSTTKPYSLPVDRQLRIHCSLRAHRNIHTAMDWFIDWNHRALVFISELANGGDFSRYLERRRTLGRPVSTFTCTSFADQLIAGIAHLHRHGILHRDIKPNNLLLFREDRRLNTRRGPKYRLQIADFGIARHLPSGSTLTASSVGTPRYLSPEQVRGDAYGLAADIWMAGLVLAELLTSCTGKACVVHFGSGSVQEAQCRRIVGVLRVEIVAWGGVGYGMGSIKIIM